MPVRAEFATLTGVMPSRSAAPNCRLRNIVRPEGRHYFDVCPGPADVACDADQSGGHGRLALTFPTVQIGVRHGWFWSAVLGAILGYSTRDSGINSRVLIGWLVLSVGIQTS